MTAIVSRSIAQRRLLLILLAFFAGSALMLAALGLYALMSYAVTQRTKEIGIRMALGARNSQLMLSVQWQGLRLVLGGLAIGLAGAVLLMRLMTSILFRTQPYDPLTFGCVAGILILAGSLACFVPAARATRVDPVHALRRQ